MRTGVVVLALAALLMLTGVLPVADGGQDAVFRSPVFLLCMGLVVLSTIACVVTKKPAWKRFGFYLTHLSAVLLLIGGAWGALKEQKFDIQLRKGAAPLDRVRMEDGSFVNLGFGLSLKSFKVQRYPPDLLVQHDGETIGEQRLKDSLQVRTAGGALTVSRLIPNARVSGVELAGVPELVVGQSNAPMARIAIDGHQPPELTLPGGGVLQIGRVYNRLPSMLMGETFQEPDYPVRPGLMLTLVSGIHKTMLSLPAGGDMQILSRPDPGVTPALPRLEYRYPEVRNVSLSNSEEPHAPFAVELVDEEGEKHVLLQEEGPLGRLAMGGDVVTLGPKRDKSYAADLSIVLGGQAESRILAINKPIIVNGWRLYLHSYDSQGYEYIAMTLRKDPGNGLAVTGMLGLMVGTGLVFLVRRRPDL